MVSEEIIFEELFLFFYSFWIPRQPMKLNSEHSCVKGKTMTLTSYTHKSVFTQSRQHLLPINFSQNVSLTGCKLQDLLPKTNALNKRPKMGLDTAHLDILPQSIKVLQSKVNGVKL